MKRLIFTIVALLILSFCLSALTPTYVRVADKPLYEKYLFYCNRMVLDTVQMVGYKTVPMVLVTYVNNYHIKADNDTILRTKGNYLTQRYVLNTNSYSNQSRKRTYKNVPKAQPKLPTLTAGKTIAWFPIVYYCKQRRSSVRDFYEWYYVLPVKPQ